jgi:SCY1-like protein 1
MLVFLFDFSVYRLVRDQAFKAIQLFVKKLEEYTATLVGFKSLPHCHFLSFFQPETVIDNSESSTIESTPSSVAPVSLASSAAGAAGTLAGWAISSLGKKVSFSRYFGVFSELFFL